MSGTSISRQQANKGIDQLEEVGVTSHMFQEVFLGGLLSDLGAAVVAGRNIKDDVLALLSGAAIVQMVKRLVSRVPFEPTMLGPGLSWWLGPADGDGLVGEELDCDQRSLVLTEFDFIHLIRKHCLREDGDQPETSITGEEKLKRMVVLGHIRLDPAFGWALVNEPGQKTLRWLHDAFGISYLDFPGRVLRNSVGFRYVLCLYRCGDGSWCWDYRWLGRAWERYHVSALAPVALEPQELKTP